MKAYLALACMVLGTALATTFLINEAAAACGDGIIDSGEDCDDANEDPADCCDGCKRITPGCLIAPSGQAKLRIKDAFGSLGRDKITWSWRKAASPIDLFGDPTALAPDGTTYGLCIVDTQGHTPNLVYAEIYPSMPVPTFCNGKPIWIPTATGFRHLCDPKLILRGSPDNGRITFVKVGSPAYFDLLPLQPTVVVQLHNSLGHCWTAEYGSGVRRNDGFKFVGVSD